MVVRVFGIDFDGHGFTVVRAERNIFGVFRVAVMKNSLGDFFGFGIEIGIDLKADIVDIDRTVRVKRVKAEVGDGITPGFKLRKIELEYLPLFAAVARGILSETDALILIPRRVEVGKEVETCAVVICGIRLIAIRIVAVTNLDFNRLELLCRHI